MAESGTARALADGNQIPFLGLGVWQVPNGPACVDAVRWALELGYRHGPAGTGRYLSSETAGRIAARLGRTPAQVRWCLEREIPVIPKSTHRERIAENARLFDFTLTDEDVQEFDRLDTTGGTDAAL